MRLYWQNYSGFAEEFVSVDSEYGIDQLAEIEQWILAGRYVHPHVVLQVVRELWRYKEQRAWLTELFNDVEGD